LTTTSSNHLRTVGRHQVVDVFYVTDQDGGRSRTMLGWMPFVRPSSRILIGSWRAGRCARRRIGRIILIIYIQIVRIGRY
jgi:hypothetical protein